MTGSSLDTGKHGEQYASDMLKDKGYNIITSNYHSRFGEIDIICEDEKYLVFVEVKTRSSSQMGLPREYVTKKKQGKIIKTALMFLAENKINKQIRFDVVEIVVSGNFEKCLSYNHIENAFMLW